MAAAAEQLSMRIRAPVPTDEAFIFRTWLDSVRVTAPQFKQVRDRIFFPEFHKTIEHVFARGAKCLVAGPEDDDTVIYGYIVFRPDLHTIHFVYVKSTWRELHVATRLIEATGIPTDKIQFTVWTSYELALNAKKEAARRGVAINWKTLREVKASMAAEREAAGTTEGDTRVLMRKYPQALYNPFLLERG